MGTSTAVCVLELIEFFKNHSWNTKQFLFKEHEKQNKTQKTQETLLRDSHKRNTCQFCNQEENWLWVCL